MSDRNPSPWDEPDGADPHDPAADEPTIAMPAIRDDGERVVRRPAGPPPTRPDEPRNLWPWVIGIAVVALLVVGAGVLLSLTRDDELAVTGPSSTAAPSTTATTRAPATTRPVTAAPTVTAAATTAAETTTTACPTTTSSSSTTTILGIAPTTGPSTTSTARRRC